MMMPRNVPPAEVKMSTQRQVMAGVPTFPHDPNVLRQPPHSGFVPTCGFPGSKRPSAKDFGHLAVQKVIVYPRGNQTRQMQNPAVYSFIIDVFPMETFIPEGISIARTCHFF